MAAAASTSSLRLGAVVAGPASSSAASKSLSRQSSRALPSSSSHAPVVCCKHSPSASSSSSSKISTTYKGFLAARGVVEKFGNLFDSQATLHSTVASQVGQVRLSSSQGGRRGVVTMVKRSVGDLTKADLEGKRVLVRADLNVPLDDNFNITDDTRIRAAVPTVKYLMERGAKVLLSTHLGRPKGVTEKYRLTPLVGRLSELLGIQVVKADDCVGDEVAKKVAEIPNGGVVLLENVRFYPEETKNDPEFSKKLAANADLYVNDAFGTAHRAHSSTEGVTAFLRPSVAGFLLQKELDYLEGKVKDPARPFVAIVGGSKVSSKIGVIESLLAKCDKLILGGGMIFTFYKAQGLKVGSSLVEEDKLELAKTLMAQAKEKGVELMLPSDVVIADKFSPDANSQIVAADAIPDGWMGLDIGPDSTATFNKALEQAKTVIWNGPAGVFEFDKFAVGTESIARKLADLGKNGVITIVGGGDSVAAVEKVGVAEQISHISTGGGASLELLEGKVLPGVAALDEAPALVS
ncbi:hypothetical protein CBR_g8483 [Chara braunii]|uniref:Phosphoglycerate kinase n=1 Tax=Chara braunii TaxID=69332 RepID=A0A388KMA5_CHABU|nr:hypothetical protein CBR_g8483 [Chara braunii]|eukprot:GBG71181.1 hypothetical protein CBR_g8483 [Chara braunii]